MEDIFLAVLALDRKAKARPADRDIGPAADAARFQELRYPGAAGHHAPAAIRLLAQPLESCPGIAVTEGAVPGHHRSDERSVGTEWVGMGVSRGSASTSKKNKQ